MERRWLASCKYAAQIGMYIGILALLLSACISVGSATTITVSPGESIQDAIDALPADGGVVELAPGVHDVYDTIVISQSDVTIQGTHNSEIRSHDSSKDIFVIPHENPSPDEHWDTMPVLKNFLFKGFKVTSEYTSGSNKLFLVWNVENLIIEDILDESGVLYFISNNPTGGDTSALSKYIYIRDNVIHRASIGCCYTEHIWITNNTLLNSTGSSGLNTNRDNKYLHIIGNYVHPGSSFRDGICVYSSQHWEVRDNIFDGGRYGIYVSNSPDYAIVSNNTIKNCHLYGIYFRPQSRQTGNNFMNNRIYNCGSHGIYTGEHDDVNEVGDVEITNNVIYNCGGDGVHTTTNYMNLALKNNIFANNGGYGINHGAGGLDISYNDVWNNADGEYKGISAGGGDISVEALFVDTAKEDFHLKSDSPCIDAGDPSSDYRNEPTPNGDRINMGAYGNTDEATVSASTPDNSTPTVPSVDAIVGYWKFDEGLGNTTLDSSGNNNSGTINGANWIEGMRGMALSFDGTNDYVDCGLSSSLKVAGAITVGAWVNWSGNANSYFVTKLGRSGRYSYDLSGNTDGTVEFRVSCADGSSLKSSGTITIPAGEWVYLVGTYEPSSYVRLFVNGALAKEDTTSIPAAQSDNGLPWCIGAREGNKGWFNGIIDEVTIYTRALSAEEIRANYEGTTNKPPFSPYNPSPSDSVTDVSIDAVLCWTGGDPDDGDTVTCDVYFGTSISPPLVAEDQSGTTYDPGLLNYSTEYYWRINAMDNHGASNESEVWSFVTASLPSSDLVADWHLDGGSGITAVDSSGNGNDGTLMNNPAWVDGKVGKGLSFDGTNDYVDCGLGSSLKITGAITVGAWVNWSGNANSYFVTKLGRSGRYSYDLSGNTDGTVEFRVSCADGSSLKSSGTITIPTGEWVYLVGTYEPSSYVRLFVDGALAKEDTTSIPAAQSDNGLPWCIGAREGNKGWFNGIIDEVTIYTRALSAEEIRANYEGTTNKPPFSPYNPSPSDSVTDVSIDAVLCWTGGDPDDGDTVTCDVYFGTSINPTLVAENQQETTYDPGTLEYSTEYYWQIVAKDNHGAATGGVVWSFVTASASDPGLVAVWHLDEGSGLTAVDSSGNGNDGTLVNNPAWETGKEGTGLRFDGINDYVDCGLDTSLEITGAITVEAWVNWLGTGNDYFVTKLGGSDRHSYDLSGNSDGTVEFRVGTADGSALKSSGTITIPAGEWVYLVGTYEPSNYVRLFVNGALAKEDTTAIPAAHGDNGLPWYIGVREGNQGYFDGVIDEVKIYAGALSAEEIRAKYEAYLPNQLPYTSDNPSPSDGATEVSIDEALCWTGGDPDDEDTVTYDVYFGTSINPTLVAENQVEATYDPGTLEYSTEYYWQIVAKDNHGAATGGEVWSFLTASASDPGLVAVWHLDEGSGLTAVDSSGNGNDGTLVNNPAWETGKEGTGLRFDGTNDYVDCGLGTSLKIRGAITVEAWVKWTGGGNQYFVTKLGGSDRHSYDLSGNSDGTVEFRVGTVDGSALKSSGTITIPAGEWVYLVGTYEPSSYVRLFLNGALAEEETTSIPASQGDNGLPWYIGVREGNQGYVDGVIDEVKIYAGALSAEEIRAKYEAYLPNQLPYTSDNPSPSDGATEVSIDEALCWTGGDPDDEDTVTYDVYFGTSINPTLVAENQVEATYDPGTLEYSTEYYWQIVAKDNHGAATGGEVWSFLTASASDPGLVAVWHLDEGSGLTAVDSSGNGNDGTLVNNPAWETGKEGTGLRFDGTNDYVDCGLGTSLKIRGAITVEAWVKWTGGGNQYFVTKLGGSDRHSYDLSGNSDGTVEFRVGTVDGSALKSSGTITIPAGEWVYLVGTYEPSSYVRLFLNGALAEEETTSIPASQGDNGLPWYIGVREGNQGYFDGVIDEVKIYAGALSAEEIRAKYEAYLPNQLPYTSDNPSPSDGATEVSIDEALCWTGGDPDDEDTVTYDVYFGTSINPTLVAENQVEATYDPGTLEYSTEYYWQIVAKDNHGAATGGEVWSFLTASASDPGLVAVWHLDEGSGLTAVDSSGNGNDGTLMNNPAWVDGKVGKGLSFDGTNDYVDCGLSSSLKVAGAITVGAWVNWSGNANSYFVTKLGRSGRYSYDLSGNTDGTVEFRVSCADGSSLKSSGTITIPTGEWVYLVGTYEPSSYVRLFVDGALAKEDTTSIPAAQSDNGLPWCIGAREGNKGWFNGIIDEVTIYTRALSAEEIRANYEGTTNKPPFSPYNPSPPDSVTDVSIDAVLCWTGGDPDDGDTVTCDVYFGTSISPPLVAEDQSGTTYDPGLLNYSTEYYWRINAMDNHGASNESEVWSFVTASLPSSDLVADWHLDGGSGITAVDSSGNGNDGTLMNNPAWVDGKVGKGLSFDGTNDYVDCGLGSSLKITGATTVGAWVNWSGNANSYFVTKLGRSGRYSYDLSGNTDGTVEFRVSCADGSSLKSSGTITIPTGEWVYLVGTYEPSSYVRLFVDGALAKEDTTSIPAAQSDNGLPWCIGAREGNKGWFNGIIDEVTIYTRALSAEEIRADYQSYIMHQLKGTNDSITPDTAETRNLPSDAAPIEYIWLEAEDANILTPDFEIASDTSASNAKYIQIPDGLGFRASDGEATYTISIDSSANYVIWGRKIAATKCDNSFFVQIDDGTRHLWTTALSENWQWDAVNHWGNGEEFNPETDPVVFSLSPGEHTIRIIQRQDGAKLDRLLITNDLSFVPC